MNLRDDQNNPFVFLLTVAVSTAFVLWTLWRLAG